MEQQHIFVDKINWEALGLKGAPRMKESIDHFLCQNNVTVYNHKHMMQGDFSNEGIVNDFFSDIKQPSKAQVDRAMLLIIGDDYRLKAGGDTISSSQYSSSYNILIADPKTGLDKEVVLMKKWSKDFKQVLITSKEIRDLFRANTTPKQKKAIQKDDMQGTVAFTFRAYAGLKVNWGGTRRKVNKSELEMLVASCKEFPKKMVSEFIDSIIARRIQESTYGIIEDQPGINKTQQHKERNLQQAEKWKEFKGLLFGVVNSPKLSLVTH